MFRWSFVFVGLLVCMVGQSLHGCNCESPPQLDGKTPFKDGSNNGNDADPGLRDTLNNRDQINKEPEGCPKTMTQQMSNTVEDGKLYAVLCPPPTITGCYSLQTGPLCDVANVPTATFLFNKTLKTYEASHAGSIEDNTHGELKPGADATKPDQLLKLPEKTAIKALFSGISVTFQFDGENITITEVK